MAALLEGFASTLCHFLVFIPVFLLLLILGIVKAILIAPIVFFTIFLGNTAVIIGLYPYHVAWTCWCITRTKKFGIVLKLVLLMLMPIPALLWPAMAIACSISTGLLFGIVNPLMATFEAVREGVENKLVRCFKDGTLSTIRRGWIIVNDFKDICLYSYSSFMDGLLKAEVETSLEIRLLQMPGCILAAILGLLIDVPMISLIVIFKTPVMLFKGWKQLIRDLIGRSGPFLETVCVPFAGLSILLWPVAVGLTAAAGIISSYGLGCYAAAIAYQENSTKSGILYVISAISIFDEFTNDFLYLPEGSCFPRPKYRKTIISRASSALAVKEQPDFNRLKFPIIKTASMKLQELTAVMIWQNFFKGCEAAGIELVAGGVILVSDLEAWQSSKNEIVNIGLPSYAFLQCFIRSIKSGVTGFVMRDNVELTSINRPEGRVFDWLFEPMLVLKEQIRAAQLEPTEEAYLCKLSLCGGDAKRLAAWRNGGVPPMKEAKKAQLEGLSRRLQGFSLTLSRMPTFRRLFGQVVKVLLKEAKQREQQNGNGISTYHDI